MRFGVDAHKKARRMDDDGGNVLAFKHRRAQLRRAVRLLACSWIYARILLSRQAWLAPGVNSLTACPASAGLQTQTELAVRADIFAQ